jgi:hypothetical protein
VHDILPSHEDNALVPVQIAFSETALSLANSVGGRWNPEARLQYIRCGNVKGTELQKHIVLDDGARTKTSESNYYYMLC